MGAGAGTGEALPWAIASDVPSTSPGHRTNSGAHGEAYSMHTYAFKHSMCGGLLEIGAFGVGRVAVLGAPA